MASISDDLRSAEAFFKHMHDIAMSNSCQHLCKVVTENEELRQKNGGWEITNRNNIESLATLRLQVKDGIEQASVQAAKLEELTKEKKEVEAALAVKNSSMVEIEKKLHAKDSEVITLTKRVKQDERNGAQLKKQMADGEKSLEVARDEKAQMSKELSEMRASFSEKSERLDRLEKLEVKLQNPRKEELYVAINPMTLESSKAVMVLTLIKLSRFAGYLRLAG